MQKPLKVELRIPVGSQTKVIAHLSLPEDAKGLVIFSLGDRLGSRDRMVADYLVQQQFGTLSLGSLIPVEKHALQGQATIRLVAEQLIIISEWLLSFETTQKYHQGYFGTSAGAAAALYAAAAEGTEIAAIVSHDGRPDLATEVLPTIQTPTLLIVTNDDKEVLQHNMKAMETMHCSRRMEIIPAVSHSIEEKSALEKVCIYATTWFEQYLHPIRMIPG